MAGFLETYFAANPAFAARQGRHEFDGQFPDWSEAGLRRWALRLRQLRDRARSFLLDPSDSARRFERDYLIARIDRDLFWQERAAWPHRNPEWYIGPRSQHVSHEGVCAASRPEAGIRAIRPALARRSGGAAP